MKITRKDIRRLMQESIIHSFEKHRRRSSSALNRFDLVAGDLKNIPDGPLRDYVKGLKEVLVILDMEYVDRFVKIEKAIEKIASSGK